MDADGHGFLGDPRLRPLPLSEVRIRCSDKDYVGAVLNRRFVRLRCKGRKCQEDGYKAVYHIWDILTGRLVANDLVDDAGVTHRVMMPVSESDDPVGGSLEWL